jgi:hypothetical protein
MIIPVPHMAKRRLDGVAAIDGDVAMQDLLQHLSIGDEALPLADQPFEQSLCVALVRVRRTDQIHGDIRIH